MESPEQKICSLDFCIVRIWILHEKNFRVFHLKYQSFRYVLLFCLQNISKICLYQLCIFHLNLIKFTIYLVEAIFSCFLQSQTQMQWSSSMPTSASMFPSPTINNSILKINKTTEMTAALVVTRAQIFYVFGHRFIPCLATSMNAIFFSTCSKYIHGWSSKQTTIRKGCNMSFGWSSDAE